QWTEASRLAGVPVTLASHGMSPLALSVWPVVSVTVTVRLAAAARRDPPSPTVRPPAAMRLMSSFVLFIRAALSPPTTTLPCQRSARRALDPTIAQEVPAQDATEHSR